MDKRMETMAMVTSLSAIKMSMMRLGQRRYTSPAVVVPGFLMHLMEDVGVTGLLVLSDAMTICLSRMSLGMASQGCNTSVMATKSEMSDDQFRSAIGLLDKAGLVSLWSDEKSEKLMIKWVAITRMLDSTTKDALAMQPEKYLPNSVKETVDPEVLDSLIRTQNGGPETALGDFGTLFAYIINNTILRTDDSLVISSLDLISNKSSLSLKRQISVKLYLQDTEPSSLSAQARTFLAYRNLPDAATLVCLSVETNPVLSKDGHWAFGLWKLLVAAAGNDILTNPSRLAAVQETIWSHRSKIRDPYRWYQAVSQSVAANYNLGNITTMVDLAEKASGMPYDRDHLLDVVLPTQRYVEPRPFKNWRELIQSWFPSLVTGADSKAFWHSVRNDLGYDAITAKKALWRGDDETFYEGGDVLYNILVHAINVTDNTELVTPSLTPNEVTD